jgi:CPA2 family monovalent cation:H+ antiporter-2/glutathione-regulated potassium-efflux system protein KefB
MLLTLVILLGAIAIVVPLTRRAGFGSILGYLLAGVLIGPSCFGLVTNIGQISEVSELGVVMLLFLIGMELRPHRLWILRKAVFGLGLGQMVPASLIIGAAAHFAVGLPWTGAILLGVGLSLSSTAIVLPMLAERNLLASVAGRDAFAVLLFQDITAIPLVALVPLLSGGAHTVHVPLLDFARGIAVIAAILIGGSFLLRPVFRIMGGTKTPELFTATALLLVIGTAALADWGGLSAALGAFMAGVLVSDSEYRHEIQADIEPFEGLLLGFFFISVGMSANLSLLLHQPVLVLGLVLALVAAKSLIGFAVSYTRRRLAGAAWRFALALPEGSEFSFVLFGAAVASGALEKPVADMATLVVALSMILTPVLFTGAEKFIQPRFASPPKRPFDKIDDGETPVIICGFGRMGQIVGRILTAQKIRFTALDKNQDQVDVVRRFGAKVFYGDPSREEVMRAAGADAAKVLVVALDDMDASVKTVQMVKRKFPHLRIVARARNRHHVHLLMALGVEEIIRETFLSSLKLTEMTLDAMGVPHDQAARVVALFKAHDEQVLHHSYAYAHDETRLIQTTQEATEELRELFQSDQEP